MSLSEDFDFLPNHPAGVCAPLGWRAGNTYCGLKKYGAGKLDLGILISDTPASAAGVFTTNVVRAAPVVLCEEVVRRGKAQAIIYNAGIANACTGEQGLVDAREMARLAGEKLNISPALVLVTSTGVIGHLLPMDKIQNGVEAVNPVYGEAAGADASFCIMTTDTRPKRCVARLRLDDKSVIIGGMCKGAGMIHPNMATMLCYLTTDTAATPEFLQKTLSELVEDSFNAITVDGDTSTNDSVLMMANGMAENKMLGEGASPEDEARFKAALREVMVYLAKEIVRDGEGATKLIEVRVQGARDKREAHLAARAAAGSSLLKSAVYGSDPNWGRTIAAMGRSGAQFDSNNTDIWFGEVALMLNGVPQKFEKAAAQQALAGPNVIITVDMHTGGEGTAIAWGCDLTEQYVVINSEYET